MDVFVAGVALVQQQPSQRLVLDARHGRTIHARENMCLAV